MDNPETMVALGTQDTGQISVRENPRINQGTRKPGSYLLNPKIVQMYGI